MLAPLKLAAADLARLDAAEAGEARAALRAGEVALGDRFRLRLLSEQLEQTMRQKQRQSGARKSARASAGVPLLSDAAADLARRMQDKHEDTAKKSILSGDTMAIMVTARMIPSGTGFRGDPLESSGPCV